MTPVLRVAWYRFRSTLRLRAGALIGLAVLIALLGGVAMGAVAGARRTQSSYTTYLARTRASDLTVQAAIYDPPLGNTPYDASTLRKIRRIPHVEAVGTFTVVDPETTLFDPGRVHVPPGAKPPIAGGSLDGEYASLDRVSVVQGRLARPGSLDEVVVEAGAERELGVHLGSVVRVAFFTNSQLALPNCCPANGTGKLEPHLVVGLKVVGVVVLNNDVVEDDIDALSADVVLLPPRLIRRLVPCCAFFTQASVKVDGGARNVPAVEAAIARSNPLLSASGALGGAQLRSAAVAKAERAIAPESIALGVFGGIAGLAMLLVAGQAIGRELRQGGEERAVLRALGAQPVAVTGDGLLGVFGAVVVGSVLAGALAVALSPHVLLGPVRSLLHPGVAFDWTVLGLGVGGAVLVLGALAGAMAYRQAPQRQAARRGRLLRPRRLAGGAAARAGFPPSAVTGIRFALDPEAGADTVPVRSVIVGGILSLLVVTSTITFGASLHQLVSHPALYGWNWDAEIVSGFSGDEDLPRHQVATLLDHDRYVWAWSGMYLLAGDLDGRSVPMLAGTPGAPVAHPFSRATAWQPATRWSSARAPWPASTSGWATSSRCASGRASLWACRSWER